MATKRIYSISSSSSPVIYPSALANPCVSCRQAPPVYPSALANPCIYCRPLPAAFPSALAERVDLADVFCETTRNKFQERCNLDALLMEGLDAEVERYIREFLSSAPNGTGFYYPRYEVTRSLEHGSPHISYLVRPYYNYMIRKGLNSRRFVTLTKKKIF